MSKVHPDEIPLQTDRRTDNAISGVAFATEKTQIIIIRFDSAGSQRQPGTGHFTQVVWSSSKRLGVGVAIRGGKIIVVTNYDPPGNYNNLYRQNVFPSV